MRPDIEAIRQREQAATAGQWSVYHRHVHCTEDDDEAAGLGLEIQGPPEASMRGQFACGADARFIAHARTDIPALLAYVEELERAVVDAVSIGPERYSDMGYTTDEQERRWHEIAQFVVALEETQGATRRE